MAVTAHWIKTKIQQTTHGPSNILKLRSDLIGFIRVPGRHDGEHLAQGFLFVVGRVGLSTGKFIRGIRLVCSTTFRNPD